MKKILVPTDFSETAGAAMEYAVQLAMKFKSKMVLLHAFHSPLVSTEVPIELPSLESLEKDSLRQLAKLQNELHIKYGYDLKIECHAVCGFAAEEIVNYCKEQGVDLVVMGIRGAGFIEEKLIGSVCTSVIADVKIPVISVDKHIKFHRPAKLVFASDLKETSAASLEALKSFAQAFNTHVYVLNIMPLEYEVSEVRSTELRNGLEKVMQGTDHSYHLAENEDVVEGINKFVRKHNADMVVVLARQHSLFHKLTHPSITKKMAFHSNMPLMALHEK